MKLSRASFTSGQSSLGVDRSLCVWSKAVEWSILLCRYAMSLVYTHSLGAHRVCLEELYPRESFVTLEDGRIVPIFLGHPDAICDECERPFGNERKHPVVDPDQPDVVLICGDHLMRLTTQKS